MGHSSRPGPVLGHYVQRGIFYPKIDWFLYLLLRKLVWFHLNSYFFRIQLPKESIFGTGSEEF